MTCFTRSVLRWGLIGGLALGGLTLLVGPERVGAGFAQLRTKARSMFDSNISDPVALRRQLEPMQQQYESRLLELTGEVATVERQIEQFEYDVAVAHRMIERTTDDLGRLKALVQRAEAEAEATVRPVAIRFDGVRFNIDQAYNEARRINTVRQIAQDRLAQDEQQLTFLTEQLNRLRSIKDEIDEEFTAFQSQMWQLERQIDSIERNERLIDLTKQHQATLANYERMGKVGNLRQLESRLAQLKAVQEAQLKTLERNTLHRDYESQAKRELAPGLRSGAAGIRSGSGSGATNSNDPFAEIEENARPAGEQRDDHRNNGRASRSMVWSEPTIIED